MAICRLLKERPYRRSRRKNSNGYRCARTSSSPASRCTTFGRSTCQARARDHARRVFARRDRANLHAHAGRARAAVPSLLTGRLFGWDRPRPSTQAAPTFADRLTDADRARSLAPAGVCEGPDGLFRVVYRFENEKLVELINRTVQAAALSALVETANSYRFDFAVYVRSVGRLTPLYMAAIDPFRKLIVYPSLLRSVRANWDRTMATLGT